MRYISDAMIPNSQIREILRQKDWTQERVANEIGVSQSTVNRWVRGAEPEGKNRDALTALYNQIFSANNRPKVRLVGYIGAGQSVYPIEDDDLDLVEAPPGARADTVAVRVRGDSMLPMFEEGWLLYYSRQLPPEEMVNNVCIVKLSDGRIMVKRLQRGSQIGFWSLANPSAALIEDVQIEWAAKIDWIKPR